MIGFFVRVAQFGVFVALAFGVIAFQQEFFPLGPPIILDILAAGVELGLVYWLASYVTDKFVLRLGLNSGPTLAVNRPRTFSRGFLFAMLLLAPLIIIFVSAALLA